MQTQNLQNLQGPMKYLKTQILEKDMIYLEILQTNQPSKHLEVTLITEINLGFMTMILLLLHLHELIMVKLICFVLIYNTIISYTIHLKS